LSNAVLKYGDRIDCGLICLKELRNITVDSVKPIIGPRLKLGFLEYEDVIYKWAVTRWNAGVKYWESVRPHWFWTTGITLGKFQQIFK